MTGFGDGTFRPDDGIRRQDMLVSIASILGTRRDGGLDVLNRFEDAETISDYARTGVDLATQHEVVVNFSKVGRLNPQAAATRGEVAAVLERSIVNYVQRQALFGNIVDLGYRVPKEAIDSAFVVIVSI
jgi:S-layer homology domain